MIPRFRAWDKEGTRMILPKYLYSIDLLKEQVTERTKCNYTFSLHSIPLDKVELMQSTGLYDKNGKEIFEGDIVQFEDYYIESDLPYINMGIVEWSQGQFTITNRASVEMEDLLDGEFLDLTIIGNIYENPELLEVTE